MKAKGGFTLIEVMLVVLIIGVLIGMLLPAISAATVYFKIRDTENRITMLSGYIEQYKQVFGDYPLSHEPNPNAAPFAIGTSPRYPALTPSIWVDPGTGVSCHVDIVFSGNPPPFNNDPISRGGGFLYYFLMGPNQLGWSATDSNVNSCLSEPPPVTKVIVSATWQAPDALTKLVTNQLIQSGWHTNHAMYCFEDGFGSAGFFQGTIQYSARLSRMYNPAWATYMAAGTFFFGDVFLAYGAGYSNTNPNWSRLTAQCTMPYVLISSGADRVFGYVIPDPTTGVLRQIASTGDPNPMTSGVSDDITNFPYN